MTPQCYKCQETDITQLAIQSRWCGKIRYICRSCRRQVYKNFLARRRPAERHQRGFDPVEWSRLAAESRKRIIANHP